MTKLVFRAIVLVVLLGLILIVLNTSFLFKKKPAKNVNKNVQNELEYIETSYSDKYDPLDFKYFDKFKINFSLKPNKSFKGFYGIRSGFRKKSKYHIIALLDYGQVSLSVNGKKSKEYSFSLQKSEKKVFNFKTPPIKKGFHDFSFIAFKDLSNHNTSSTFRFQGGVMAVVNRTNLIAGNQNSYEYPFSEFSAIAYRDNVKGDIIVNQNKKKINVLLSVKAKAGKKTDFYVHISNTSKFKKKYAMVAFLEARQINIQSKKVIITNIEPNTRIVVPLSVKADEQLKGKTTELTIAVFTSPGILMGDKKAKSLPGYDEEIYFSNRVALIVE